MPNDQKELESSRLRYFNLYDLAPVGYFTQNRGVLYDPATVDTCLKLFKEKGFKFE